MTDTLTVTIPLAGLEEIVRRQVEQSFADGHYRDDRAAGRVHLAEKTATAVREFVRTYDVSAQVAAIAPALAEQIVREETATYLAKAVRKELKAMQESGEIGKVISAVVRGDL